MNIDPGPYLGSETNDNSMSRFNLELSDKQVKEILAKLKKDEAENAPMLCPECKKKFTSLDDMMKHLRHDCANVEITCNNCKQKFNRSKFSAHKCVKESMYLRKIVVE